MNQEHSESERTIDWRKQIYLIGAALGAVLGFLSAYLFAQEADQTGQDEKRPEIPPTTLLNLAVSTLSLVRKIAETGKKKDKE